MQATCTSTSSSPSTSGRVATFRRRRPASASTSSPRRSPSTRSMADKLRVALVGGPMYDSLYEPFIDDVDVVVHADHPTLNRRVAELLAAGERIDVLSTHSKYAPSQAEWLQPLDGLLDPSSIAALAPRAVELCRFRGALL